MGDEDRKINRPEPRRFEKGGGTAMKVSSNISVVGYITNQKNGRSGEGRDHAVPMGILLFAANEVITEAKKYRA